MTEAPSLVLIEQLIAAGAKVQAYDPMAMDNTAQLLAKTCVEQGSLTFSEHQYDALKGADAMVLVTEWKPFCEPDFNAIKRLLKHPVVIDGRNQYDPEALRLDGFDYLAIGR